MKIGDTQSTLWHGENALLPVITNYLKNSLDFYIGSEEISTLKVLGHRDRPVEFKGTVSRDFLLLVFVMNQFPPHLRVFHLDRFKFFSRVKVHHPYQRHRWQICHRYQRHRRQIVTPFSLALLIPVANLPPVSTIPAANLPPVSTTPMANCHKICRRCRIKASPLSVTKLNIKS